MTASTPVRPLDVLDPAHERFLLVVCFEVAFCFVVPTFLLFVAAAFLPMMLVGAIVQPYNPWTSWKIVAQVVFGSAGLAGVARAVYLLWTKAPHDRWRWMTLLGLILGAAVSVEHWLAVRNPDAYFGALFQ